MPRGSMIKADVAGQFFAICPMKMEAYMNILNGPEISKAEAGVNVANNNVAYSVAKNIAIIAIDGAMYKKSFSGACGETVVSYPDIIKAIDKAETNTDIDTILFRVDTPGGSVAGAEEVRYRIKNSSKKTVTFFENLGASGGMWIFTAAQEIYASPITRLGSIGVVVAYEEEDPETKTKRIELVSKNAPNKRCSLSGDCKEKLQTMIDEIETDFFQALNENTGFAKEDLIQIFEKGGIIKAEIAKEKGFIKDIRHFSVLLSSLNSNTGVVGMPEANEDNILVNGLAFSQDNFAMLIESKEKLNANILALNTQLTDVNASLEDLQNKLNAKEKTIAGITVRVALANSHGISDANTISQVICASSDEEALKVALDYKEKNAPNINQDENQDQFAAMNAYFEAKKTERGR